MISRGASPDLWPRRNVGAIASLCMGGSSGTTVVCAWNYVILIESLHIFTPCTPSNFGTMFQLPATPPTNSVAKDRVPTSARIRDRKKDAGGTDTPIPSAPSTKYMIDCKVWGLWYLKFLVSLCMGSTMSLNNVVVHLLHDIISLHVKSCIFSSRFFPKSVSRVRRCFHQANCWSDGHQHDLCNS